MKRENAEIVGEIIIEIEKANYNDVVEAYEEAEVAKDKGEEENLLYKDIGM